MLQRNYKVRCFYVSINIFILEGPVLSTWVALSYSLEEIIRIPDRKCPSTTRLAGGETSLTYSRGESPMAVAVTTMMMEPRYLDTDIDYFSETICTY